MFVSQCVHVVAFSEKEVWSMLWLTHWEHMGTKALSHARMIHYKMQLKTASLALSKRNKIQPLQLKNQHVLPNLFIIYNTSYLYVSWDKYPNISN